MIPGEDPGDDGCMQECKTGTRRARAVEKLNKLLTCLSSDTQNMT